MVEKMGVKELGLESLASANYRFLLAWVECDGGGAYHGALILWLSRCSDASGNYRNLH